MRMKEDHMQNGQLKPAYNVQISTNNQYIAHYSLHHHTTDTNTLIDHVQQYQQSYGHVPAIITADAGYGSEENYQYLQDNGITGYIKYNQFDREQNATLQSKTPFSADKLFYNEKGDYYVCPMGQTMHNKGTHKSTTTTGFKQTITTYEAKNCSNCPLKGVCHKAKGNRQINVNHTLNHLKEQAKQLLQSEQGIHYRKKRCYDVEPVFANWKNNYHFKHFMLRGKEKVTTEIGLLSLAQNLRKKATQNIKMAA